MSSTSSPSAEAWRQQLRAKASRYFVDPLIARLAATGITPNALTCLGLAGSAGAGALLAKGHIILGGLVVLLGSALDMLDGALARATGKASKFGAFLDSTTDRLAEAAILFGLLIHFARAGATEEVLLIFSAMVAGVMVSYIKARAEGMGYSCNVGLVTRPERVILLGFGLLIDQPTAFLYLVTIASFFTAGHRFVHVARQALSKPS